MRGIYYIKNINNGKQYIGSAIDIDQRFKRHVNDLKKNKHHNILLQRSWNKYKESSFEFGVIELVEDKTLLLKIEQTYLDKVDNLYNLAPATGGDLISNHPNKEEIIKKIKKTLREKYNNMTVEERKLKYGKYGSDNPNYRNGGISKKICPKCKLIKIKSYHNSCENCMDRTGIYNPFYNKKHSKKTKEILSKKQKIYQQNLSIEDKLNHSKIRFVEIEGLIYEGVSFAAKLLNVSAGTICHRIKSPNPLYINYKYIIDKDYVRSNLDKIQKGKGK